ncbi:MAG: ATP-binding cassette domain-containing protein, partial [Prevotella sp.]|nr:ATP-binding cassette domain-containing protein [Prevotella sp.]
PSMTVYENIAFVLRVIDAPVKFIRKRVPYVIGLVGLQEKVNSYPDELSGGEMQRVAIARALVNDPQLIIADEPTGNIDPELSYEIVELLKGINDQGTTILMVTHEHDLVRHFGGRIINITDGQIVFDEIVAGTSDDLTDFEPAILPVPDSFTEDDGTNAEELLGESEFPDIDFSDNDELEEITENPPEEPSPLAAPAPVPVEEVAVLQSPQTTLQEEIIINKVPEQNTAETSESADGSIDELIASLENTTGDDSAENSDADQIIAAIMEQSQGGTE